MNSQCVHKGTRFLMKLQSSMLKKEKNLFKCKAEKQLSLYTSSRRDDIEYIANSLIFFSFDYNGFSFIAQQFRCRPAELNSPLIMHEQLIISAHLGEIYGLTVLTNCLKMFILPKK